MKKFIFLIIIYLCCPLLVTALNEQKEVQFDSCIDGDTANFIMDEKKVKVRFLAVDTPETKHPTKKEEPYGKEASNYTCNALKNASNIVLEFDDGSDKTDKYDRYLAWIIIDGNILQKDLVKQGLAKVAYLYGDYAYTKELQDLEKQAQKEKLNIWNDYVEETNYSNYIIIGAIVIILILCLFSKKIRKNTANSIKKETKSYLKKQLKKSDLFKYEVVR